MAIDRSDDSSSEVGHRALIAAARLQIEDARRGSSDALSAGAGGLPPRPPGLHKYRLIREIHRGGQGVVFLAEQSSPRRQVAVKMVREGPLASRGEQARFQREIEALGSLSHPNIVGIHDSGEDAGQLYYVMDYVDGPTLDEYVRRRREELGAGRGRRAFQRFLGDVLRLFAKICDAVQAAHLRGIIHRDLKPSNIRVDAAGEPRVLDFGLAKSTITNTPSSSAEALTEAGQFLGTLAFASPEQASGAADDLDVRTDVYSLGVILYQLLVERPPYPVSGSLSAVIEAIRHREPTRPSAFSPELRGDLDVIVLTSLHKERERRYQTAGALAADIRRFLDGAPIDAQRDSTWYLIRKHISRHKLPVAAAVVILGLIVGGLAVSLALWQKAVEQGTRAQAEARKANAISEFLHEMLASASPYRRPGEAAEIAEVLDEAERRLAAGAFADQPDVESSLRNTLGMSYLALGRSEDAIRELSAALERRQADLPPDHPELAEGYHNLGRAHFDQSDYSRAEEHLKRAEIILTGSGRTAGVAERLAATEFWLGMISQNRGRVFDAAPRYEQALELLGETGDARLRARCVGGLSEVATHKGEFEKSAELARRAVEIQREAFGEHPYLIKSLSQLGAASFSKMDIAQALVAHREATELCRKFLRRHPERAYSLNHQGHCLLFMGEYEAADACFVEGLSILNEFFDADDMRVQSLQGLRARTLWRMGRFDEATAIDQETIATCRRLGRRMGLATALINHAESLRTVKRFEEAEAGLREAVDILRRMQAEGNRVPLLANALRSLGSNIFEQGRHTEGEPFVREALDMFLEMPLPIGTILAGTRGVLAECAQARSGFAEAETLLLEAVDDLERHSSPPSEVLATRRRTMERLVSLYQAWGEAEPDPRHSASAGAWQEKLDALPRPGSVRTSQPSP